MRSNGQAFKPGGQDSVATPLCGVSAQSAVVADRGLDHFGVGLSARESFRRWTLGIRRFPLPNFFFLN